MTLIWGKGKGAGEEFGGGVNLREILIFLYCFPLRILWVAFSRLYNVETFLSVYRNSLPFRIDSFNALNRRHLTSQREN